MKKIINLKSLFILFVLSLLFYWFQWRPSKIKQDCSWVKHHTDAIQAREGLTESQLKEKGMLVDCPLQTQQEGVQLFELYKNTPNCYFENRRTIELNKPIWYVPAKDWWEKATKDEYTFCLHDKGL